jgi:CheY-like chemotaxis protein
MDMNDPSTKTSGGCCYYHYHYNKSERISGFSSHDPKYYDQIITKLNLQAREQQHERNSSMQDLLQDQITGRSSRSKKKKKKKRVLVVDDDPDICMVYQMVLEDAGFECISYIDPVKALQEFRIDYYDLILLDIKMPVLNGFELCKKIRQNDKTVHIVFITALPEYYKDIRDQSYHELRNAIYIQKPIRNDELVRIVDMIVGNSITMDQINEK